jgi:hypothetical protein
MKLTQVFFISSSVFSHKQFTSFRSARINDLGTKTIGSEASIYEYNLTVAWDINCYNGL